MPNSHLLIVGKNDAVLFEFENWSGGLLLFIRQFIGYAALDALEDATLREGSAFLPKVYRPTDENVVVSAYVGLASIRLILIQDCEPSEIIRSFFMEAYKVCAQYFLNPFFSCNEPLKCSPSRKKLEDLCRMYL